MPDGPCHGPRRLYVTHDQSEAMSRADQVILLQEGRAFFQRQFVQSFVRAGIR
jgi:ABC-type sugar transport system ATPase subunit